MKKILKRIVTIMLMTGILITTAFLVIPASKGYAADPDITAVATPNAQSGIPGSVVTYSISVTNNSSAAITVTLAATSAGGWTSPTVNPASASIDAGNSTSFSVIVPIPSTTTAGQNDITTVSITNGTSNAVTLVPLTTSVINPTATPVATQAVTKRPLMGVYSYSTGTKPVKGGSEFQLAVVLLNSGQISAYNTVVTYSGDGFLPRNNGGIQTLSYSEPGQKDTLTETFFVSDDLDYSEVGTIKASVAYTDASGTAYTDTFTITISLNSLSTGPAATATPKNTIRPQLVIIGNSTDVDPLQPGSIFNLTLDVKNMGTSDARSVIMVLGGGATTTNDAGTPQPGVSGSGADLTNFAPLGSSNVIVVGDVLKGSSVSIKQKLVVNVSTVPGAYTLKTSFSYTDDKGTHYIDDQVITLLVYSLPQVEVNFYRDPGMISVGMPNTLPLQVTNLGKKSSVLGNMKVTSPDADITNNVALVGALDPGGYFTLDSMVVPNQEGKLELDITIDYTDDFNQSRQITQTLTVDVSPAAEITPELQPGDGKGSIPGTDVTLQPTTESFWSKVGRFLKGLFGLDSGLPQPVLPSGSHGTPTESPAPVNVGPKG